MEHILYMINNLLNEKEIVTDHDIDEFNIDNIDWDELTKYLYNHGLYSEYNAKKDRYEWHEKNGDLKNGSYKIFYKLIEVADFDTMAKCNKYIKEQLQNDPELKIKDFSIYGLIG